MERPGRHVEKMSGYAREPTEFGLKKHAPKGRLTLSNARVRHRDAVTGDTRQPASGHPDLMDDCCRWNQMQRLRLFPRSGGSW
jgi:hypothetical protein